MELLNTKKIALIVVISTVVVLALIGVFIPESRPYVSEIAKMLLNSVATLAQ